MKYLKEYQIFESRIYAPFIGSERGNGLFTKELKNQSILNDIKDMVNDLEDDTNIEARLWVSNHHHEDVISSIRIELNHDNLNLFIEKELNEFRKRLKSYINGIGRIRQTYSTKQQIELCVNIFE